MSSHIGVVDPYRDTTGKWAALFRGDWNWRWFGGGFHLYYRPGASYRPTKQPFVFTDILGRETHHSVPFDCTIDPHSGKVQKLYVQATDSVCRMSMKSSNCTWKRTPVRNVSDWTLRLSTLVFSLIPHDRRDDSKKYTAMDKLGVVMMWIPTVIVLLLAFFLRFYPQSISRPRGKTVVDYMSLPYGDLRFARLARHYNENRRGVIAQGHAVPSASLARAGNYRAYRPKFLYYIVEVESADGTTASTYQRRKVGPDDHTPYIFISWTRAQFKVEERDANGRRLAWNQDAMDQLNVAAFQAAVNYFETTAPHESVVGKAFWLSQGCLSSEFMQDRDGYIVPLHVIENGKMVVLDKADPRYKMVSREETNRDIYSMSDIVRSSEHVIVLSYNGKEDNSPGSDAASNVALRAWGDQVWTLPEAVLAPGRFISISHLRRGPRTGSGSVVTLIQDRLETVPKTQFPARAWEDHHVVRQLVENFANVHLSRLELMTLGLEAVMKRNLRPALRGDRAYALMSLMRVRPPIDKLDSSFQAFARMSFPQDSEKFMERLICLLPSTPNEDWEHMRDQYQSSVWDINPDMQVCAVGENDTVIIDGAKGAQIQWDSFTGISTQRGESFLRRLLAFVLRNLTLFLIIFAVFYFFSPRGGIFALLAYIFLVLLPSPWMVWKVFGGKFWNVEPAFFGIEGFMPVEVVEEFLFGIRLNRMKWSAFGSPLSRHEEGMVVHERKASAVADWSQPPRDDTVDTYPVVPINPCATCDDCARKGEKLSTCDQHETYVSCQRRSSSAMGEMKVFTLVDTLNMEVTIFHAVRPPTALVVGATEGGMKRAIACSIDVTTGTLYRETVLRLPSRCADHMSALPRIRLGLRRPFHPSDVTGGAVAKAMQETSSSSPPQQRRPPFSAASSATVAAPSPPPPQYQLGAAAVPPPLKKYPEQVPQQNGGVNGWGGETGYHMEQNPAARRGRYVDGKQAFHGAQF